MSTTRILTQHDPQVDYHDWWLPGLVQWLDTAGHQNRESAGSCRWHVAECNNTGCPATAIIREDAITALLPGPTEAACDRGPCHLPHGHEGRCNPGGDAR